MEDNWYFTFNISQYNSAYNCCFKSETVSGWLEFIIKEWALFKADDWNSLASKIGIIVSSTDDMFTVSDIIFSNKYAVYWMIKNCIGDFMISAIQNEIFMSALALSPYTNIVYENEHWENSLPWRNKLLCLSLLLRQKIFM